MSLKDLKALIETLREAGADAWTILVAVFGIAFLASIPSNLRAFLTFFNKRREIDGNLARKLKKLDLEIAEKQRKAAKKAAEALQGKPPAATKSTKGQKP